MEIVWISTPDEKDWIKVLNACRGTVNKENFKGEKVSDEFKSKIFLSEHSPIRILNYHFKLIGIPYSSSVHLSRHNNGINHFVSTQRSDRTGVDRTELSQKAKVNHEIVANAQALINISRKRLCFKADKDTRDAWNQVISELKTKEPELYGKCVPDCVYRGGCCEFESCGFEATGQWQYERDNLTEQFKSRTSLLNYI